METLNKKEILLRRKKNVVYNWWGSLTEQKQYEIMLDWYPTEVKEDTDIDKMFGDMLFKYQFEIYEKEKDNREE